jgi:hypothetical protein
MNEWMNECKRVKKWCLQQPCFEIRCSMNSWIYPRGRRGIFFGRKIRLSSTNVLFLKFEVCYGSGRRSVVDGASRASGQNSKRTHQRILCHRAIQLTSFSDSIE